MHNRGGFASAPGHGDEDGSPDPLDGGRPSGDDRPDEGGGRDAAPSAHSSLDPV
jgi:hypothetical protein